MANFKLPARGPELLSSEEMYVVQHYSMSAIRQQQMQIVIRAQEIVNVLLSITFVLNTAYLIVSV